MSRRVLVIGAGQFGTALAEGLVQEGVDVTVLDASEQRIALLASAVAQAMVGSGTDERVLRSLDLDTFDETVVAIGEQSIEASILCVQLLREAGVRSVSVRVVSDLHGRIVMSLGAHRTIHPEGFAAKNLARQIARPGLRNELEVAEGGKVVELETPEAWVGRTLQDLALRTRFGVTVVGSKGGTDGNRRFVVSPPADHPLMRGQVLLVLGPPEGVDRLLREVTS